MSRRSRIILVVAAAAGRRRRRSWRARRRSSAGTTEPQAARPRGACRRVLLDVGVRTDAEAPAAAARGRPPLARAARPSAGRCFARGRSLQAQAARAIAGLAATARWSGSKRLRRAHPRERGGRSSTSAWRASGAATRRARSRPGRPHARAIRTPRSRCGPPTCSIRRFAAGPSDLRPELPWRRRRELARCPATAGGARAPRARPRRAREAPLRRRAPAHRPPGLGRREFAAAAQLAPRTPTPRSPTPSAASTRISPARAFSRLGPLARRFPKAATVRFHLGLMLLWLGDVEGAKSQLARATRLGAAAFEGSERLARRV